jgi:hypothetical protein
VHRLVPPLPERASGLTALLLAGCAASCATYTQRTSGALADFQNGHLAQAEASFADPKTTGSELLGPLEAGMVALTGGQWDSARAHFEAAALVVRDVEDRALVSASETAESLASLAVNEGVKTYHGEGYERVLLHVCLAFTYFAEGKTEDVWVEARRANQLLESEETLYEKQYQAGGMGHFLSAVAYELVGEPGDAYIDYKRMHEKGVGTEIAGRALVRLAQSLGRDDELPAWIEQYGPDIERPEGAASVILLAGVGLGPFKEETRITLPLPGGTVQWAVPKLIRRPQVVSGLALVHAESGTRVESSLVEDVGQVAQQNLDDRIGWLATKSAVRAGLKYAATDYLSDEHGAVGWIVGSVFTMATERADLRSWITLPDSWHGARLFVAPGVHEFTLEARGGESVPLGRYELEPGETLVVLARTVEHHLYAYPIGGKRLDQEPSAPVDAPAAEPVPVP